MKKKMSREMQVWELAAFRLTDDQCRKGRAQAIKIEVCPARCGASDGFRVGQLGSS
jgi:hypothetical protein